MTAPRRMTRRTFLLAFGLLAVPATAHAHHRPGHKAAVVVTPPILTLTEA